MKMLKSSFFLFIIFSFFGCSSQETSSNISKDLSLSNIYKKYDENRYDYGGEGEEGRDSILNRFKHTLIKTLKNKKYITCAFDSLKLDVKIIKSKDSKLKLFSWDEFNNGTWHIYNGAFQYNNDGKLYAGLLPKDKYGYLESLHYEITEKINNSYLVKAYGTHGSGEDYYLYRLLNVENNTITDCSKCFNGKDFFLFEKPRGYEVDPKYDSASKEISYPEMIPSYHDGEETGFTKPSGKILKLKYKNGVFAKSN